MMQHRHRHRGANDAYEAMNAMYITIFEESERSGDDSRFFSLLVVMISVMPCRVKDNSVRLLSM